MTNWNVAVEFRPNQAGLRRIGYADALARRLGARLTVLTAATVAETHLAEQAGWRLDGNDSGSVPERVVSALTANGVREPDFRLIQVDATEAEPFQPDLAVGRIAGPVRPRAWLESYDEAAVSRRAGKAAILVPFGAGDSGHRAMAFALRLARRLEARIGLYHTTWREPSLTETAPPEDHMIESARQTHEAMLAAVTRDSAVPVTTIVETAADVSEGIVRAAYAGGYDLIVMARGCGTVIGSYVDSVASRSRIPLIDVTPEGGAS